MTIVNGFLAFSIAQFGNGIVGIARLLWWIDVAMARHPVRLALLRHPLTDPSA